LKIHKSVLEKEGNTIIWKFTDTGRNEEQWKEYLSTLTVV
jgi:hypothetical protein